MPASCVFTALLLFAAPAFTSVQTIPALLWGSGDFVNHASQQTGLQASYEVYSSDFLTDGVFASLKKASSINDLGTLLNQTSLETAASNLVSLFVLGQLSRGDLASKTAASSLSDLVSKAPSSIFLSDVDATHAGLLDALTSQPGELLRFGSCGTQGEGLAPEQLSAHLEREVAPVSGLVCEATGSDLVAGLESQLRASGRPYVVVYAGQPEQSSARPVARSLISTSNQSTKVLCDRKCQVQVRLFEVIILLVILLVALGAGMGMLHILDTPTRFEKEKKDVNRHQD